MEVREITYEETKPFIMGKHYAKRMPSISYAYGLFDEEDLVGVLTIGKPASPFLCIGLLGEEYSSIVYELNRLVINEGLPKNTLGGECHYRFVHRSSDMVCSQ